MTERSFFKKYISNNEILSPLVISGKLSREQAFEVVLSSIHKRYENIYIIMVFGSIVNGSFKELSDLDVIVINNDKPLWSRESFVDNGYIFDCHNISKSIVLDIVRNSQFSGSIVIPKIISESIFVCGDREFFDKMKDLSIKILRSKPDFNKLHNVENIKKSIISLFIELNTNINKNSCLSEILSMYGNIISSICIISHEWIVNGKEAPQHLKSCIIGFDEIKSAYNDAFNGDFAKIILTLEKIITIMGGEIWGEYKSKLI